MEGGYVQIPNIIGYLINHIIVNLSPNVSGRAFLFNFVGSRQDPPPPFLEEILLFFPIGVG